VFDCVGVSFRVIGNFQPGTDRYRGQYLSQTQGDIMIDHMTAVERMAPHANTLEAKRALARQYLNARGISVLYHGHKPTSAVSTDVKQTIVEAMSGTINDDCHIAAEGLNGLWFLRKQAV